MLVSFLTFAFSFETKMNSDGENLYSSFGMKRTFFFQLIDESKDSFLPFLISNLFRFPLPSSTCFNFSIYSSLSNEGGIIQVNKHSLNFKLKQILLIILLLQR